MLQSGIDGLGNLLELDGASKECFDGNIVGRAQDSRRYASGTAC